MKILKIQSAKIKDWTSLNILYGYMLKAYLGKDSFWGKILTLTNKKRRTLVMVLVSPPEGWRTALHAFFHLHKNNSSELLVAELPSFLRQEIDKFFYGCTKELDIKNGEVFIEHQIEMLKTKKTVQDQKQFILSIGEQFMQQVLQEWTKMKDFNIDIIERELIERKKYQTLKDLKARLKRKRTNLSVSIKGVYVIGMSYLQKYRTIEQ